jgi:hypothetical protein
MKTDLDRAFASMELIETPELSSEIERRSKAPDPVIPPLPRRQRVAAGGVAVAIMTVLAVIAWVVLGPGSQRHEDEGPHPVSVSGWAHLGAGWTPLPDLPQPLEGSVRVWTDGTLIVWGGNQGDGVGHSSQGWRLDGASGPWKAIAPSPLAPRSWAAGAWTGSELLIWGGAAGSDPMNDRLSDGAAYDPATDTWRSLPSTPMSSRSPLASVWTGSRWLLWGEGPSRMRGKSDGAAYDPATNTWTQIPSAPVRINDGHAIWTGQEMIIFGAELDRGNRAQTASAVGAAYDPATGSWRTLPVSHLDPQATAITWDGREMVAADYLGNVRAYDPATDAWADLPEMPGHPGEGAPQLATADGRALVDLSGVTALLSGDGHRWHDVSVEGQDGGLGMLSAGRFAVTFSAVRRGRVSVFAPVDSPTELRTDTPWSFTEHAGWHLSESSPDPTASVTSLWAANVAFDPRDLPNRTGFPFETLKHLPAEGIVISVLAPNPSANTPTAGPSDPGLSTAPSSSSGRWMASLVRA